MVKRKLGRDLSALLSGSPSEQETTDASQVSVTAIVPNPFQPRRHFDEAAMADLVRSIQTHGILQPVVVRPREGHDGYELVAGERRWRAAQTAQLDSIPAIIKPISDRDASALALIENIQRENLGVLEEVEGLARLRDEYDMSQQEIADVVGRSRATVANLLRLLNLSDRVKALLDGRHIEMGHARALLSLEPTAQDVIAEQIVAKQLTVRAVEALVKQSLNPTPTVKTQNTKPKLSEGQLKSVVISSVDKDRTDVTISCATPDELQDLLKLLGIRSLDNLVDLAARRKQKR